MVRARVKQTTFWDHSKENNIIKNETFNFGQCADLHHLGGYVKRWLSQNGGSKK